MRDLVRTWQRVDVETPWGMAQVEPPTVQTALSVLQAAQMAEDEPRAGGRLLRRTLSAWLPLRLGSLLTARLYPVSDALQWALQVIQAGAPEPGEVSARKSEGETTWHDIDWPGRIAEYAHAYAMSPDDVLDLPFNRFLVMLRGVSRVHAQEQLRRIKVQGLPYADEEPRNKQLEALAEQAGYGAHEGSTSPTEGKSEEEVLAWQREQLARMNRRLGREPSEDETD